MATDEPLLILAFNRPDRLAALIDRLRAIEPSRVFVAIDGPRADRAGEAALVRECQELVGTMDWPCEVTTLFRAENLGCGLGVSSAIDWFFEQVDRGIILEDDILPRPSFFGFCSELLDRYQDDPRVFAISGCNFVPPKHLGEKGPYRFSRVPHIWGWATWKDRWAPYRFDIGEWRRDLPLPRLWHMTGKSIPATVLWRSIFDLMARGKIDTWDMQAVYMCMARDLLTATANVNLVDNVGWGDAATHTFERPPHVRPSEDIALPVKGIPVALDAKADRWSQAHVFGATTSGLIRQGARYVRQKAKKG